METSSHGVGSLGLKKKKTEGVISVSDVGRFWQKRWWHWLIVHDDVD